MEGFGQVATEYPHERSYSPGLEPEELAWDREDAQDAFKRGLTEDVIEWASLRVWTHWRIGTLLPALLIYNATEPSIFGVVIHTVRGPPEFFGQHAADWTTKNKYTPRMLA